MAAAHERPSHWLIGIAEPPREHETCERIRDDGIEIYLPIEIKQQRAGRGRLRDVLKPIVRPYFFVPASLTDGEYCHVKYTRGVRGFLEFDGRLAVIRDDELKHVRSKEALFEQQRLRRIIERGEGPHFMIGEAVDVAVGFTRLKGIVDSVGPAKAKVKFEGAAFFGREVIEVDLTHISRAM